VEIMAKTSISGFMLASISICTVLGLILFVLRLADVISFAEPLQISTSGFEEESLIAIWNLNNDLPLYVSRFEFPYRWAIYNWLFYNSYASFVSIAQASFGLSDAWLPTITRILTLLGVLTISCSSFLVMRAISGPFGRLELWLALGFAIYLGTGPLIGFWAMTTRPDIWALAFEILTIYSFILAYKKKQILWYMLPILMGYAAWSFKQSEIIGIVVIILFLLTHKKWRDVAFIIAAFSSLCVFTLIYGGATYIQSVTLYEYGAELSAKHALNIFLSVVPKISPSLTIIVLSFVVILSSRQRNTFISDLLKSDNVKIIVFGVLTSIGIILLTSSQSGSAENYYFTLSFFLSLLAVILFRPLFKISSTFRIGVGVGWAVQSIAILLVIFGFKGIVSVAKNHDEAIAYQSCIGTPEQPIYVGHSYYALPWMTPNAEHTVLAFGYFADRVRGVEYQYGGIGGLIDDGFFEILLLPSGYAGKYDGSTLSQYRKTGATCGNFIVYKKLPL